jgi:hypothetical protein
MKLPIGADVKLGIGAEGVHKGALFIPLFGVNQWTMNGTSPALI